MENIMQFQESNIPEGKKISKGQETFNQLCQRIKQLKLEHKQHRSKLDNLVQVYDSEIVPVIKSLTHSQGKLGALLQVAHRSFKTVEKQRKGLSWVTHKLSQCGVCLIIGYNEHAEMYNYCAEYLNCETPGGMSQIMKDALIKDMRLTHKVIIKGKDYSDTPEGWSKFKARMQEELAKIKIYIYPWSAKAKLSNTAVQKENPPVVILNPPEKEREDAERLHNAYIPLKTILSPNAPYSNLEPQEKTDLMNEVDEAYQDKNLFDLLTAAVDWVAMDGFQFPGARSKDYQEFNRGLKFRARQLKEELDRMGWDCPEYKDLPYWCKSPDVPGFDLIMAKKEEYLTLKDKVDRDHDALLNNFTLAYWLDFLEKLDVNNYIMKRE